MEERVRSFNRLPRLEVTPTGLPNHWVFGVCHANPHPPSDLVLAVHPPSSYLVHGGPAQILSLEKEHDKAEAIVSCLLDAFIKWDVDPGHKPFAPWTWSTLDPEIAKTVQDRLTKLGIGNELRQVSICSAEERHILETVRAELFKNLMPIQTYQRPKAVKGGDSTRCHGCGMSRESFFEPLKKCAGCNKAFYHSRDCQKNHWKHHKPDCLPSKDQPQASNATNPPSSPANVRNVDAYTYYNTEALANPAARNLIRSLNIESHRGQGGIALPLRRLVLTGEDTDDNMKLLFGPHWKNDIQKAHEEARIDCLLNPPPGSPSYTMNARMDDSSLRRKPRDATPDELKRIEEVRDMQALIRQRIGNRKQPSSSDMGAILTRLGPNWPEKLATYTLAANTMDQGVPSGGYRA